MVTSRYTLRPSAEEGFWIARDNEMGITIDFRENDYNETQQVTLDEPANVSEDMAQRLAVAMKEMGDWLNVEHPDIIFNAEETAQLLTSVFRAMVQRLIILQDGEPIQVDGGNYVAHLLAASDEGVQRIFDKMELLLSPTEAMKLCERINFECEAINCGPRAAVGSRIRFLRKEARWTQQELAERAGITRANLANIEMGKYSAGLDVLWRISAALGTAVYIS